MSGGKVLDATTGGRMIWHEQMKDPDRVVFADRRKVPNGEIEQEPGWSCIPDVLTDCRQLPFQDDTFDLVCYDPPHRIDDGGMSQLSGIIETKYGALHAERWQSDIHDSFTELWRVLRPGGTMTLKWADVHKSAKEVLSHLPEDPLYGINRDKKESAVSWWVFHKPR